MRIKKNKSHIIFPHNAQTHSNSIIYEIKAKKKYTKTKTYRIFIELAIQVWFGSTTCVCYPKSEECFSCGWRHINTPWVTVLACVRIVQVQRRTTSHASNNKPSSTKNPQSTIMNAIRHRIN